jgi:hypothetical protein
LVGVVSEEVLFLAPSLLGPEKTQFVQQSSAVSTAKINLKGQDVVEWRVFGFFFHLHSSIFHLTQGS